MRQTTLAVSIAFLVVSIAVAQAQLGPKDGGNLKPTDLERVNVGETAPDFTLENPRSFLAGQQQISLNEFIDVAVENAIRVADFQPGAVILDHAVGMEHIRADLTPPGDIFFGLVIDVHLLSLLLDLKIVET